MTIDPPLRDTLLQSTPHLRAFAISLTNNVDRADDLVQETLVRAIANIHRFEPGTNMQAWLFTILRNTYFSIQRKRGREVQDSAGMHAERMGVAPAQEGVVDLADFRRALAKLSEEQREVLIMVGVSGISYEEAAEICGVAVGTVKSRVNRARNRLGEMLGMDESTEPEPGITKTA